MCSSDLIFRSIHEAAQALGIAVCGGHTEITPGVAQPIVVGQMLGEAAPGELVRPGGLRAGATAVLRVKDEAPSLPFVLPPLSVESRTVDDVSGLSTRLFASSTLTIEERRLARRHSLAPRVAEAARLVMAEPDEPWIVWCNLNAESEALADSIPGSLEVTGSDSTEAKERAASLFTLNKTPIKLVSKPLIFGYGMNWQHCRNVAFVGLSDSWEQYYQAVRRCWRFGQKREVKVHIITSTAEGQVVANIKRKEVDAARMAEEMVKHMHSINEENIKGTARTSDAYVEDVAKGKKFTLYLGDCVEVVRKLPDASVGFSVFSPPFASLYTYSASDRDMGNSKDYDEFSKHFEFLAHELFRVIMPGRLLSCHCMNLPTSKSHHGYIGLQDFRGDLIRCFQRAGFIFHSEVCIWKNQIGRAHV